MLWSNSLETGITSIDEQHKELFRQVDVLFDRSNDDRVPQTLKFLEEYTLKHFSDEQLFHQKSKYPKTEQHKKMHDEFVAVFKKLKEEYDNNGNDLPTLLKINKTVSEWLTSHIMVHDKEFAAYYKSLS